MFGLEETKKIRSSFLMIFKTHFGGNMKKNLAKLAVSALVVAASAPVVGVNAANSTGTFLAHSCGSGGSCGAGKNNVSYNPQNTTNPYDARSNTYQTSPSSSTTYRTTPSYGTQTTYQSQSDFTNNPNASRSYYSDSSDFPTSSQTQSTVTTTSTISETELYNQLNNEGKRIFNSLDARGRNIALQLASQANYRDKNLAVKEAQRIVNDSSTQGRGFSNQTRTDDFNR